MELKSNKLCKNCGKPVPKFKYFCDIKCEVKYTEALNQLNEKK